MYRHHECNNYRCFGISNLVYAIRAKAENNRIGESLMLVNFTQDGAQSQEPFWKFISCCISTSPDFLGSNPDLCSLNIKLNLNDTEIDVLTAWNLYEKASNTPTNTQAPPAVVPTDVAPLQGLGEMRSAIEELIGEIEQARGEASAVISNLREAVDSANSAAAEVAGDIASDYARERVIDVASDENPDFYDARDEVCSRFTDIENTLREML